MKIINLTPHALNILTLIIPPSGQIARCKETKSVVKSLEINNIEIPVIIKSYGNVENLPAPQDGVIYVVSALVGQALQGSRPDVYVVGDTLRNKEGQISGAISLAQIPSAFAQCLSRTF